jgi:hypothetical protein
MLAKSLFRIELTDSDRITRATDFGGAWPTALTNLLITKAGMAELADAADLKDSGLV